jgi:hypothetical protein
MEEKPNLKYMVKLIIDFATAILLLCTYAYRIIGDTAHEWIGVSVFPGYQNRYGLKTINEASFYQFPAPEGQYAFWSSLIYEVFHKQPAEKLYFDPYHILRAKQKMIDTVLQMTRKNE